MRRLKKILGPDLRLNFLRSIYRSIEKNDQEEYWQRIYKQEKVYFETSEAKYNTSESGLNIDIVSGSLPDDTAIEETAKQEWKLSNGVSSYNLGIYDGFEKGAKWMREIAKSNDR